MCAEVSGSLKMLHKGEDTADILCMLRERTERGEKNGGKEREKGEEKQKGRQLIIPYKSWFLCLLPGWYYHLKNELVVKAYV